MNMRKWTVPTLAMVVVIAVWGLRGSDRANHGSLEATGSNEAPPTVRIVDGGTGRVIDGNNDIAVGSTIIATPNYTQTVLYDVGMPGVRIRNYEESQGPAVADGETPYVPPEVTEYEFSTSYAVERVVGRQANELYILGRATTGEIVVEQWTINVLNGAYYFRRAKATSPVGVAVSGVPATTTGIQGGVYVPAAQRLQPGRQQRTELLRTNALGIGYGIACDPEGRFILLLCGDSPRTLYRLDLLPGAQPVAVFDSNSISHLQFCRGIHAKHHVTSGRMYLTGCSDCPPAGSDNSTILFDSQNDGLLDQHVTLSLDQYAAAGYWDSVWVSNFRAE